MEGLVERRIYPSLFSNPVFVYGSVWTIAIILFEFVEFSFMVDSNLTVNLLIVSSILSFGLIYKFVYFVLNNKNQTFSSVNLIFPENKLESYLNFLFLIWITFFLLTCLIEGGFPLLWLFTGSSKTYADFGMPVIGGA